ncbi:unnamed protein product [Timema podura]|uniref:Uncharacterized protein n=1 Tax=Timema podura TaxID=61482 RepID=A0ABN7NH48_TIMPD|nr:unnamed protein product [Timema podura]
MYTLFLGVHRLVQVVSATMYTFLGVYRLVQVVSATMYTSFLGVYRLVQVVSATMYTSFLVSRSSRIKKMVLTQLYNI